MKVNEKSYYLLYRGDIESAFIDNGIDKYIILNDKLASIYVSLDFDETILDDIEEIQWWSDSDNMSSLVNITNNLEEGETATDAAETTYVETSPYINVSGKGILIAVIDSGVSYLHRDLINSNNESKILYLWDQESDLKDPPEGMKFGSEFTNEDLNKAIEENDGTLSVDNIGTGTMVCGILVGEGNLVKEYRGIARDAELVVVKLRGYDGVYYPGKISYTESDFLAAITYVTKIAEEENKPMIINLTVGTKSNIRIEASILETYKYLQKSGMVLVSGAGNEGNTDIHYTDNITLEKVYQDVIIQNGENINLDVILSSTGPDKIAVQIISPSGDTSEVIVYSPDDQIYTGKFYLEGTSYRVVNRYPWLETGEQALDINLLDIKPGIWILRLIPEFIIHGNYDLYLPNKNLISRDTRFIDPSSIGTITEFALSRDVIAVGAYNGKTNSLWIGSSKGGFTANRVNPDLVAAGVDIISTYIDGKYNTATGTGVSSSIVCGSLALMMQYLQEESGLPKLSLFTDVLRTYLVLGVTRDEIFEYPNLYQGYGILNLTNTFIEIAKNL
ncbi:bile acid germinant receptor pseudoprotease CspC [Romboutsia sp.]|uniref:bile acid germinant receptor pseudoprotease CspC n=1 Tax=Romboutsia sp. TaxID=1965302 RepID=UPI002C1C00A1|nr:bile acid germinant receptor pseudoprotease CspC [Romboutsia sp.]HSQ90280.1 bile acid germinant receptor pseudoprotease CspC [Romboutsia sp.]